MGVIGDLGLMPGLCAMSMSHVDVHVDVHVPCDVSTASVRVRVIHTYTSSSRWSKLHVKTEGELAATADRSSSRPSQEDSCASLSTLLAADALHTHTHTQLFIMDFEDPKQLEKEQEEERAASLKRRKEREAAQTDVARVSLKRRPKHGFGLGIADTDGHCLIHRLVGNEYYNDSAADAESPDAAPRLRLGDRIIKVGDNIVLDYYEAIGMIKATPEVLDLTVIRDPNAAPLPEWLRDRLYNYSKPLYYTVRTLLIALAIAAVLGVVYAISLIEAPKPQTPRHDYEYPFGTETPGHPEPYINERDEKRDWEAMMMRTGHPPHMMRGMHGGMYGGMAARAAY